MTNCSPTNWHLPSCGHRCADCRAVAPRATGGWNARLRAALPYTLTGAQERAFEEIRIDMASSARMLRLLQGDVGSGKTAVALLAMLNAVEAGAQAALMAPTEILARQHFERLSPLLGEVGVRAELLTGRGRGKARAALLAPTCRR